MDGFGRFVNHSKHDFNCEPHLLKLVSDGPRVGLFSTRMIHTGEELLFDYKDQQESVIRRYSWLKPKKKNQRATKSKEGDSPDHGGDDTNPESTKRWYENERNKEEHPAEQKGKKEKRKSSRTDKEEHPPEQTEKKEKRKMSKTVTEEQAPEQKERKKKRKISETDEEVQDAEEKGRKDNEGAGKKRGPKPKAEYAGMTEKEKHNAAARKYHKNKVEPFCFVCMKKCPEAPDMDHPGDRRCRMLFTGVVNCKNHQNDKHGQRDMKTIIKYKKENFKDCWKEEDGRKVNRYIRLSMEEMSGIKPVESTEKEKKKA